AMALETDVAFAALARHPGMAGGRGSAAGARAYARFPRPGALTRELIREVFRLEHNRCAVGGALRRAGPGVAIARERLRVCRAFRGNDALERVEPMQVVSLTGVGIAGRLRALDLLRQDVGPFRPSEQTARMQSQRHGEGLRFPRLAEDGAFGIARNARNGIGRAAG